jgi:hypothetical protein
MFFKKRLLFFLEVKKSYDRRAEHDVCADLDEEVYAYHTDKEIGKGVFAACPGSDGIHKECHTSERKHTGVYNGTNDCRDDDGDILVVFFKQFVDRARAKTAKRAL